MWVCGDPAAVRTDGRPGGRRCRGAGRRWWPGCGARNWRERLRNWNCWTRTAATMMPPLTMFWASVDEVVDGEQVGDRREDEHAEQGADDRAPAAAEQRAADDRRGDRVELVEVGHGRLGRGGLRGEHDRGDAAAQPGQRVEQHGVPPDVDAGQPGRLGVAADRDGAPAERGAVEQHPAGRRPPQRG